MSEITEDKISLFNDIYRARQDIYAVRWEKDGKSGYMPAYEVDWSDYQEHKSQGGTFKDYTKKEHLPYDHSAIKKHLTGIENCGVYPLLDDNTSWFIAADFDDNNWKESITRLYRECSEMGLPSYIERSRSGNGGHLWIFFKHAFPAEQSRKIMFELLRLAGIISHFQKETGFDRLFPNQDFHSGKQIGNLIALPLHGKSIQKGNTCFLDPDTLEPYQDQWEFIRSVVKVSQDELQVVYQKLFDEKLQYRIISNSDNGRPFELEIVIKNQIFLKRGQLSKKLVVFLREQLNFFNQDYLVKKNLGFTTYKTEKYFNIVEESDDEVMIPRGFSSDLVKFCKKAGIPFNVIDRRAKKKEISVSSEIELTPQQSIVLEKTREKDFGVIVLPPGSGKTVVGLEIIAEKRQPALIIVHRKQLFDQWLERIQDFLKIPKKEIGQIATQKCSIGKEITIAMIQSLVRLETLNDLSNTFGSIIVDECHHIPAKSFREVIVHFNSYFLYGLTATPKRKNNDQRLIFVYIGKIIHQLDQHDDLKQRNINTEINIRNTELYAPFDFKIDKYETISRILIHDTQRNAMILKDIEDNGDRFRTMLVLTERKEHIIILNLYLKDQFETITIHGDDSESKRKSKIEQIKQGHFKIVISTGQYFGEGVDIKNLECLFIVYLFAFVGKLVQYIGRIQRSEHPPVIFDYRDHRIDYFEKMFKQRNRYYKKLLK